MFSKHFTALAATVSVAAISLLAYHYYCSKQVSDRSEKKAKSDSQQNLSANQTNQTNSPPPPPLLQPGSPRSETAKMVQEILNLPLIDLEKFFQKSSDPNSYKKECEKVAKALHDYGVLIIKDPRVDEKDNNTFLDLMERYFAISDGIRDARPDQAYQVGVTPELIERPRNHKKIIEGLSPENKPLSSEEPVFDPKWRYFWRIGPMPKSTRFPYLNPEQVIPLEFPEWKTVMDMWGYKMLDAVFTVAEMAATGFGMPSDTFTSRLFEGAHLLAPTASNFNKYGKVGTVLAGFHSDLNFLTIHGKSRYPGLSIWTREGKKYSVAVPDGCLLIQAGKQIEYLTGGYVHAGYHEVCVTPTTAQVIEQRKRDGKSLWRISSTLFGHIQSDQVLQPLPPFDSQEAKNRFPPIYTAEFVRNELQIIALDRTSK